MADDDEKRANRLACMGIDAGGWIHELRRQGQHGVPLEHLVPTVEEMMCSVQAEAARGSGKRLYDVTLRFARILAEDKDQAIEEAEAGFGHLVERKAYLVYDPAVEEGVEDARSTGASPSELEIPPATEHPPVDLTEFFMMLDEACLDPATGETVLPDYLLMSQELYEAIVPDASSGGRMPPAELSMLKRPVHVVPHTVLEQVFETEAHLVPFDRRGPFGQTAGVIDGAEGDWGEAIHSPAEA